MLTNRLIVSLFLLGALGCANKASQTQVSEPSHASQSRLTDEEEVESMIAELNQNMTPVLEIKKKHELETNSPPEGYLNIETLRTQKAYESQRLYTITLKQTSKDYVTEINRVPVVFDQIVESRELSQDKKDKHSADFKKGFWAKAKSTAELAEVYITFSDAAEKYLIFLEENEANWSYSDKGIAFKNAQAEASFDELLGELQRQSTLLEEASAKTTAQ